MNKMEQELQFVSQRFNRDAVAFDAIYHDEANSFYQWFNRQFRKPVYERFAIAVETVGDAHGKTIIDVGCGSGIYIAKLALNGAKRIVGVDFSQEMLKLAAQKIKNLGCEQICELKQANFLELTLNEKFDYAIAMGVFDYLPDPVTFLRKLKTVTNKKVIASFPCFSLVRGPLRRLRYVLTARGNVYYYNRAQIEKLVSQCGFSDYQLVPMKSGKGFVLLATP